jgi:DNA-binding beta-propeller fold protein YncE
VAAARELFAGDEFAGHEIEAELGRGGMGVVYRARHLALDRLRALKVIVPELSADERFRARFQRESRLAASIEHPNVIPIHHAGEEDGLLYLAMRLVDGRDLRAMLEADGRLEPAAAARILTAVAASLDAAHARGLVHRDVKPANVLIEEGDDAGHVFLTDFGISRVSGRGGTVTSTGEFLGSVDYVAPEQVEGGEVDGRADVYSLGCVAYHALTGAPPFPRDNDLARLFAHANAPRPRASEAAHGLSTAVDDVIAQSMAIDPDDRYPTAGALAADLEQAVGGVSGAPDRIARPRSASEVGTKPIRAAPRGRRALVALLAVVALAIAAALVVVLPGDEDGSDGPDGARVPQPSATATVDVGRGPVGLTVGEINVWVASREAGEVYAIDPITDAQARSPVPIAGDPTAVAVGHGSIWVVNDSGNSVVRLDPGEGEPPETIPVGAAPSDIAVDASWVWVSVEGQNEVARIDPDRNLVDQTVPVDSEPRSVAIGEGAVWVANIAGGTVSRIDPASATTVGNPIPVGPRPNDLAVGDGAVWVTDVVNGTVNRVDAESGEVGKPIDVGVKPRGIKVGLGYVWIANGDDDNVVRVDAETEELVGEPVLVGDDPADLAIGAGSVWTTNFGDATVSRIDPQPD